MSVLNLKILQQGGVLILLGEAGVTQIAVGLTPVLDAAIIEETEFIRDDKRYNTVLQALPEKQQAPYASVAVLEWVDTLKTQMNCYFFCSIRED